jgi:hypothetical protein
MLLERILKNSRIEGILGIDIRILQPNFKKSSYNYPIQESEIPPHHRPVQHKLSKAKGFRPEFPEGYQDNLKTDKSPQYFCFLPVDNLPRF